MKTLQQISFAIATAALLLAATATVAQAQVSKKWTGSNAPADNLVYVDAGGGVWQEYQQNGRVFFTTWRETGRTATSVSLYDASRNYRLTLTQSKAWLQTTPGAAAWVLIQGKFATTPDSFCTLVAHTGSANGAFGFQAAGTDAEIQFRIHGTNGVTDWTKFPGSNGFFEARTTDTVRVKLANVGTPREIEIKTNGAGDGPDWYPSNFELTLGGRQYTATNNSWITTNAKRLTLR